MSESFLSQEEVDALLEGVTGESQKSVEEAAEHGEVRPTTFPAKSEWCVGVCHHGNCQRTIHGNLRVGLFNFIRRSPEISVGPVTVQRYSAFLRELACPPISISWPFDRYVVVGWWFASPHWCFGVIDTLYGGIGKFQTRN